MLSNIQLSIRRIAFTLFKWDIQAGFTALHAWTHFAIHRSDSTWHLVWGKLSIHVENWTLEVHRLCAQCNSADIGEVSWGNEGLTVCQSCGSVEQGYEYVNAREYERAS